mmetsp:Transcript_153614/g.282718  ORF Transcript_153614/g.282718 Transcript_153614/m.282718 type:complete len:105 (-) Transcript_153614:141-455(-)
MLPEDHHAIPTVASPLCNYPFWNHFYRLRSAYVTRPKDLWMAMHQHILCLVAVEEVKDRGLENLELLRQIFAHDDLEVKNHQPHMQMCSPISCVDWRAFLFEGH